MVLLFNKYVFFICKGNVIGVWRYISIYIVIFDFYVRSKEGLCCDNGKCVLLKMESVVEVCKYIRLVMNFIFGG